MPTRPLDLLSTEKKVLRFNVHPQTSARYSILRKYISLGQLIANSLSYYFDITNVL